MFRGDSVELILEVNGVHLMCRRSLERRPVDRGAKMRILLYRVNVFNETGAEVVINDMLKDIDIEFM